MPDTTRECGTCTACCQTHPVEELRKGIGVMCQFCVKGHGCRIYNLRPKGCAAFLCQWRKGLGGDADRPDKSKVVIDFYGIEGFGAKVFFIFEVHQGASQGRFVQHGKRDALAAGCPVCTVSPEGKMCLHLPKGFSIEQSLLDDIRSQGTEVIESREEVAA